MYKEVFYFHFSVTENVNTNYQLVFNPTTMSWVSAATWCEVKGGNLVSLDSQAAILMVEWYKDNDWSAQWYFMSSCLAIQLFFFL